MELNMDSYYNYLNALSNDTIKTSNYQAKQLSSLFHEDSSSSSSVSSDFDICLLTMINESKDAYQIIADNLTSNINSTNTTEQAENTSNLNSEFQSLLTAYQNLSSNIPSNLYHSASLEESLFSMLNNDSSAKTSTISSLFQTLTNSENTAEYLNTISALNNSTSLEESLFSMLNNASSTKVNTISSVLETLSNSSNTAEVSSNNSENTQSNELQLASAILNGFFGQNTSSYYLSNLLTSIIRDNTTT